MLSYTMYMMLKLVTHDNISWLIQNERMGVHYDGFVVR